MALSREAYRTPGGQFLRNFLTHKTKQDSVVLFLEHAYSLVDEIEAERRKLGRGPLPLDVVEYLKRKYPTPAIQRDPCKTLPSGFKRKPDILLGNLRFGRTRLFLSNFIGDLAWRGVGR